LIDGMPVFRPNTGTISAIRTISASAPNAYGARHSRSAQAAKAGERCSP